MSFTSARQLMASGEHWAERCARYGDMDDGALLCARHNIASRLMDLFGNADLECCSRDVQWRRLLVVVSTIDDEHEPADAALCCAWLAHVCNGH